MLRRVARATFWLVDGMPRDVEYREEQPPFLEEEWFTDTEGRHVRSSAVVAYQINEAPPPPTPEEERRRDRDARAERRLDQKAADDAADLRDV
jgi:hypothetical protein